MIENTRKTTRLVRTIAIGTGELSLDGGRVRIRVLERNGATAKVLLEMDEAVVVDREGPVPALEQRPRETLGQMLASRVLRG